MKILGWWFGKMDKVRCTLNLIGNIWLKYPKDILRKKLIYNKIMNFACSTGYAPPRGSLPKNSIDALGGRPILFDFFVFNNNCRWTISLSHWCCRSWTYQSILDRSALRGSWGWICTGQGEMFQWIQVVPAVRRLDKSHPPEVSDQLLDTITAPSSWLGNPMGGKIYLESNFGTCQQRICHRTYLATGGVFFWWSDPVFLRRWRGCNYS